MTKTFEFDSDHYTKNGSCRTFTVEVKIVCHDKEYAKHEIRSVSDSETGEEIPFENFPSREQSRMDDRARDLAGEFGCEAYEDALAAQADALYDAWRERNLK